MARTRLLSLNNQNIIDDSMMPNAWSAIKSHSNNKVFGAAMASDKKIVVSKNGPYVVFGGIPLSIQTITPNKEGLSWEWKKGRTFKIDPVYYLCRCGNSKNSHFAMGHMKKYTLKVRRQQLDNPLLGRRQRTTVRC
jgi:CDGSH-type Zn-finger protein